MRKPNFMKHTALLLLAGLLLAATPNAQAQRNKVQQQRRFTFMTTLGYGGGLG